MKVNRGGRAYVPSRTKTVGIRSESAIKRPCPDCQAYAYTKCRIWREEDGVRYVVRTRVTFCPGRRQRD